MIILYDVIKNWKKCIKPHLQDRELNDVLVDNFNKYTYGRWGQPFLPGQFPCEFETCDWTTGRRGPKPSFCRYVKHGACHWLVNFNLRLASLVEPDRAWRILTSDQHSTVWDGNDTLFDLNAFALGGEESAKSWFDDANEEELLIGQYMEVNFADNCRNLLSS